MNLSKLFIALIFFHSGIFSQECTYVTIPAVIDGVSVTHTYSGDVSFLSEELTAFCPDYSHTLPIGSVQFGASYGAIEYTVNFSAPVNNICFKMAGGLADGCDAVYREYTVITNTGIPTVFVEGSCAAYVEDNVISINSSELLVVDTDPFSNSGGAGIFTIYNPDGPYTSITFTEPGTVGIGTLALCSECVSEGITTPILEVTDISCFGDCNGSINVVGGDYGPYTYLWCDEAGGGTEAYVDGLCAGLYSVIVTSISGEAMTLEAEIIEPDKVGLLIDDLSDVTCNGASNGSVIAIGMGGIPGYTYTIGMGTSASGEFTELVPGDYILTVVDQNDCLYDTLIKIIEPDLLTIEFETQDVTCYTDEDGIIEVTTNGGTGALRYSIDGGPYVTTNTFTGVSWGVHDIVVKDENDCFVNGTVVLASLFPTLIADFAYSPNGIIYDKSEVIFTDLSTGSPDLWEWTFGAYDMSTQENPTHIFDSPGIYNVNLEIIDSQSGCKSSISKLIQIYSEKSVYVPNAFTPGSGNLNNIFLPILNGFDPMSYHLTIFNRWGEMLFESYDMSQGWDGSYGGELVENGIYVWTITATEENSDSREQYTGHITLIR